MCDWQRLSNWGHVGGMDGLQAQWDIMYYAVTGLL